MLKCSLSVRMCVFICGFFSVAHSSVGSLSLFSIQHWLFSVFISTYTCLSDFGWPKYPPLDHHAHFFFNSLSTTISVCSLSTMCQYARFYLIFIFFILCFQLRFQKASKNYSNRMRLTYIQWIQLVDWYWFHANGPPNSFKYARISYLQKHFSFFLLNEKCSCIHLELFHFAPISIQLECHDRCECVNNSKKKKSVAIHSCQFEYWLSAKGLEYWVRIAFETTNYCPRCVLTKITKIAQQFLNDRPAFPDRIFVLIDRTMDDWNAFQWNHCQQFRLNTPQLKIHF